MNLGIDYAVATVSEVVVHSVHVREEVAVQRFVHGEAVVVGYSLTMCYHWRYVYSLWEEGEEGV